MWYDDTFPPTKAVDYGVNWRTRCPGCEIIHEKAWSIETDLCKTCQKNKVTNMHYANGREAKNGDRVIRLTPADYYSKPMVGILHDAVAGNDMCNGSIAEPTGDRGVNLAECLHIDDLRAVVGDIKNVPNTSK